MLLCVYVSVSNGVLLTCVDNFNVLENVLTVLLYGRYVKLTIVANMPCFCLALPYIDIHFL